MKRIDDMLVVLVENPEAGEEGVTAGLVGGRWFPLIATHTWKLQRIEQLREAAQRVANDVGKEMRFVRFMRAEVVETFKPRQRVVEAPECPICHCVTVDRRIVSDSKDRSVPKAGDVTICAGCLSVNTFVDDGNTLRPMTDDEIAELPMVTRQDITRSRRMIRDEKG
jgi:hypothetical protein